MNRAQHTIHGTGPWLAGAGAAALAAVPALARQTLTHQAPAHQQPENTLVRWVWIAGLFVAIWVFLYKLVYPFLVRHYRPDASKAIFWTLFWLYSVTCLQVLFYKFFVYDPLYTLWVGAIATFLGVLFLIAFLVVLLRHPG